MRTETTTRTLYQFGELSDKAKQRAIENLYYINIDHDWWEFTYETIQTAGDCLGIDCTIDGFDLDRGSHVALSGRYSYRKNWRATLRAEFGGDSLLELERIGAWLQDAQKCLFWSGYATLESDRYGTRYSADADQGGQRDVDGLVDGLREFEHWALTLLRHEYEYLTSEEAIIETIEANEYEFDEAGNLA